jgi:hypothetical protein
MSPMTKKVIMIMTILLMLLVPSVIAVPKIKETKTPKIPNSPKKEIISFTESATLGAGNIYLGNQQISDTGILYIQNAISIGKINTGDSPISGFEIQTSLSGTLNLNTYLGDYHGQWISTGESGAYEGTINGKVSVSSISGKFIGIGIGEFENQKIKGTFEGLVNNFQVEITIKATITSKTI